MARGLPTVMERIAGGLLGVAAGDALGVTLEFAEPNTGPDRHRDVIGGGPFGFAAGQPTDDSELTAAVVRAYLSDPLDPVPAAARNFLAWYHGGPRDIGNTTASALARLAGGTPIEQSGATTEDSAANGSLMRCLPTGLVRGTTIQRRHETRAISAITHAEPRCIDACVAYNDIAAAMIDGADPREALQAAVGNDHLETATREALAAAISAEADAAMPWSPGGYVLTSLRIGVWALLQRRPAEDVVIDVVNMGGDADTNGAIAGGLLGVRDGLEAWPTRWTERLWLTTELLDAADRLCELRTRT